MTTTERSKPITPRGMTSCILMVDDFPFIDPAINSIALIKNERTLVVESIDKDGNPSTLIKGKDYAIFTLLNYGLKEHKHINVIGLISKQTTYSKLRVSNDPLGWSCIVPLSKYTTKDKVFITVPGEKLVHISVLCNPNVASVITGWYPC